MSSAEKTCPVHPQCLVWKHSGPGGVVSDRCVICGRLLMIPGVECGSLFHPFGVPDGLRPGESLVVRTFAYYRECASRTDGNHDLQYYAGGLCEEAGELWGALKKHLYHGHPLDRTKVREELGDALWLLDQLAKHLGFSLEEVAAENVRKLKARYPDGFSEQASRDRVTDESLTNGSTRPT